MLFAFDGHVNAASELGPGHPSPGIMMPPLTTGNDGALTWLPSTPIRKLLSGSPPSPQTPVSPGALQTDRSPKPMPSAGVRTMPTPLMRSKARAHPARITVFFSPKRLPKSPPEKDGFQAAAMRVPTFE